VAWSFPRSSGSLSVADMAASVQDHKSWPMGEQLGPAKLSPDA
jgi:hypothetical protein